MAENMLMKAILQFDSRKAIQEMGKAAVSFKRLEANTKRIQEGGAKAAQGVTRLTMGLAPLSVGVGLAVKQAADFENEIGMIGTITDEATFPAKKLEAANMALALSYGTGPTEQVSAMYNAISSGADTVAKATARMDSSNKLAIAGGAELTPTLKLMNTVMNTYGEAGLSASGASNILFQTTKYGVTTIGQLASSLGDVVPTAQSLKIGFNEVNAAIATATLRGAETSEAATGLNMALVNVLKPTKVAADEAERLGIAFNSQALKSKGLVGFLGAVIKKTGGSEEAMTKLFGSVLGFKTVMKVAGDGGKKMEELAKAIGDSAGSTNVAFKKMADTTKFKMKQLGAYAKTGSVLFGQVLTESFMKLASPVSDVAKGFVDVLMAVKSGDFEGLSPTAAGIAKGITQGIETVKGAIDSLMVNLKKGKSWFEETFGGDAIAKISKWGTIFLVAGAALAPVLAIMAGIGFILPAIITFVTGAFSVIAGVFGLMFSPLGILIGVLAVLAWYFRDELPGVARGFWDVLKLFWADMLDIFSEVGEVFSTVFFTLSEAWADLVGTAKTDSRSVGQILGAFIMTPLKAIATVLGWIAKVAGYLIIAFVSLGKGIGEAFGRALVFLNNFAIKAAGKVVSFMEWAGMTAPKGLAEFAKQKTMAVPAEPKQKYVTFEQLGLQEASGKAKTAAAKAEGKTALEQMMDDIKNATSAMKDSAAAQKDAAKKKDKPPSVQIDGREVAKANAKADRDIQVRSGETATPWQQAMVAIHGARPMARG